MSHEVKNMFSAREVPWHGLGNIVSEALTSKEALIAAGLDFTVEQVPVEVEGKTISWHVANVRADNRAVLGFASPKYSIVQNIDAFDFVDSLSETGQVKYETAGSLFDDKKVWLLAKTESMNILGDKIDPYLAFMNGFDGKTGVRVAITPVRVVCNNTLTMAFEGAKKRSAKEGDIPRLWTTRHTGDIKEKLEEARRTLNLTSNYLHVFATAAEHMAEINLSKKEMDKFVTSLFPLGADASKRQITNVETMREAFLYTYENTPDINRFKTTAWGVYNAVSDFATHLTPRRKNQRSQERIFEVATVGSMVGVPLLARAQTLLAGIKP
jgi:phage/plasmid-like protein (TIGR03299 family)